jgi:hypothetical protein
MPQKNITRRALLKAILAGSGGIAAASFLPEKWLKPVVQSGVLPVHAATSSLKYLIEADFVNGGNIEVLAYVPGSTVMKSSRHLAAPAKILGAPVPNILITMNYRTEGGGTLLNLDPPLPRSVRTDDPSGIADFGTQDWDGISGTVDSVIFTFHAPNGSHDELLPKG